MADKEFGRVCQKCKKKGGDTFARMYYRPIDGKWLRLCGSCWGAVEHSVHPTVRNVREIETVCPNCNLVFDVKLPESHAFRGEVLNVSEFRPTMRALDFAICAPEYHASLDEAGDRFCRTCGKPLSQ